MKKKLFVGLISCVVGLLIVLSAMGSYKKRKQAVIFCEKQVEFLQKSTLIVQHKQENERKNYVWYLAVLNFCSGFCRLF